MPMLNEACFALYEGLGTVEDIDTAIQLGLNHPMGPLALVDLIGLDTCARDPRGAAPRARRPQVPALPAAAPVRRGRLAGTQERARLPPVRRASRRRPSGADQMSGAAATPLVLAAREGAVATLTRQPPGGAQRARRRRRVDALAAAFEALERRRRRALRDPDRRGREGLRRGRRHQGDGRRWTRRGARGFAERGAPGGRPDRGVARCR